MKNYADNLWDKIDIVLKQSNDRRKQLEDFINAISKRIEVEQNYAKNIQGVGKLLQKYIKEKGAISLTYSAFKSNSFHRAEQARVFAQSLRDEILIMLKELLNNQNLEYKKLQKDARKYEKDMQNYVQNLTQAKNKFIDNDKYKQEQQILNEIAKLSNEFSVDKKQKQMTRTKQLQKQTRQYESVYRFAIKQYNEFVTFYNSQMKKIFNKLQEQQAERTEKQVDTIMKLLVFETSMMRNFDYDITNISNQMDTIKPDTDIITFIEQNATDKPKYDLEVAYTNPSLLSTTLYKIINKQLDQKIEFEKNKELKNFIQKKYREQEIKEIKDFKEVDVVQFNKIFDLVSACWKSQDIQYQQLNILRTLIQKDNNRHIFLLAFRHYGSMSNLQLPFKGYFTGGNMLQIVLEKCSQRKDVFVIRKLMNLLFSYWSSRQKEQIKTQIVNTEIPQTKQKKPEQKILLYFKLMNMPIWKSIDYWQAAIFESIHEQLKLSSTKKQSIQETILRQKNIIFTQLASFCHYMVMLGINTKVVRQTVGKYCRYYDLSQQNNKDLSKAISNIYKQYKQIHGGKSIISKDEKNDMQKKNKGNPQV